MIKQKTIDGDIFFYYNEESLDNTYRGVMIEGWYEFKTDKPNPFIIDGGGHYGVALVHFKKRYKNADILVFEPDPNNVQIIKKIIDTYKYSGVKLIECAISDHSGKTTLYGELSGEEPDSLGNSIIKSWGDRGFTTEVTVNTVLLSDYIKKKVDFLKLNIEGSEWEVLEDLINTRKIREIKDMCIHYHNTRGSENNGSLEQMLEKLRKEGFSVSYEHLNLKQYLPEKLSEWSAAADPEIYILKCVR